MKTALNFLKDNIISLLLFAIVIAITIIGIVSAGKTAGNESAIIAENSVRRAAVSCYAIEGMYPPSLDYLKENYNLYISDTFIVHYNAFASNIMPDITVIERAE